MPGGHIQVRGIRHQREGLFLESVECFVLETVTLLLRQIARYFFSADGGDPVLRAEDANRDGRADRWIAYQDRARRSVTFWSRMENSS